jgi:hypothetical protein
MCDFAIPPIEGLHDIRAMATWSIVTSAVFTPSRADASAASHPAWPEPTIITSKYIIVTN